MKTRAFDDLSAAPQEDDAPVEPDYALGKQSVMADKLIGLLLEAFLEVVVDSLIACFRLENVARLVCSVVGLATIIGGAVALWLGWM